MFNSQIDTIRFKGGRFKLKGFNFLNLTGEDVLPFLNNFLTTDIKSLKDNQFQISCRLNIRGQFTLYLYAVKKKDSFLLFFPKSYKTILLEEFEKYIISEDVEWEDLGSVNAYIYFDPFKRIRDGASGLFLGEYVKFIIQDEPYSKHEKIQPFSLKTFSYFTGWPLGDESIENTLINNLYLNDIAIDYKKGCFLGQETAAKIHNNRGAASFPCLVHIDPLKGGVEPGDKITSGENTVGTLNSVFIEENDTFLICALKREERIDGRDVEYEINGTAIKGTVYTYPYFKENTSMEKSNALLESGLEAFQEDDFKTAKSLIEDAIKMNGNNADAYESLGVICGREGNFEKAIQLMNRLQKVDPTSVMAHTNKSLYFMKLGKIEEAEEEKSQATLKTFENLGREAKVRKSAEAAEKQRLAEFESRAKMFKEVLELDPEDEFANIQLAKMSLEAKEYEYIRVKYDYLKENFTNNPELLLVLSEYLSIVDKESEDLSAFIEKGIQLSASKGNKKALAGFSKLQSL